MAGKWIQDASERMKKKGTTGSFTAAANRAGEGVQAFAAHELASPNASPAMKKKANFARNMGRIAMKRGPDTDNDGD